jgi:putative restriction endonuclease
LGAGEGRRIYEECIEHAAARSRPAEWTVEALQDERFGQSQIIRPRLGQRSFRLAVLDAYGNACSVTGEHSLPVLDAAHIRPYALGGGHELPNGLPFRRDLHRLFDLGYVTVRPDRRFIVSPRLREDFANGHSYYPLDGKPVADPRDNQARPSPGLLEWHYEEVFKR